MMHGIICSRLATVSPLPMAALPWGEGERADVLAALAPEGMRVGGAGRGIAAVFRLYVS